MAEKPNTPSRRAMLAGLAVAPVAGLPAIAGVAADDDPIFAAFEEYRRAKAADELAWKASEDCQRITAAALDAAGLSPKQIMTRQRLEILCEIGGCSAEDYEKALAKLDGSHSEYRKMLEAEDALEDAARDASEVAGETERALLETAPTTRAGALRLLCHLADFLDGDDVVNDLYLDDVVGDAIRAAVAVLEPEARS